MTGSSPGCTDTRDTLEAFVMWSSMSVTISSAVAICQREPGMSCVWVALALCWPGPGSPPTFTRRTPASPWIPAERCGHCRPAQGLGIHLSGFIKNLLSAQQKARHWECRNGQNNGDGNGQNNERHTVSALGELQHGGGGSQGPKWL